MNERTNVTDKGYTYNGKNYVYETRTNPVTNSQYQVAVENNTPSVTIQNTEAQRKADQQTASKFDAIAQAKGLTPSTTTPTATGTTTTPVTTTDTITPTTTPTTTTTSPTTTTSTTNPWDVKEGDTPEAIASKNATKTYIDSLDKQTKEVNDYFDQMRANSPIENQVVMDQIKTKFAKTRELLAQNQADLLGVHEKMGYASGGNRYTQGQNAGILSNDVSNYLVKLSELDSQEATAIMEASQARKKGDWDMLSNKINMLDKIGDNRATALKNLNEIAVQQLKNAQSAKKITEAEMAGFSDAGKFAESLAPLYLEQIKSMDAKTAQEYLTNKSKENNIPIDVLKSAIYSQQGINEVEKAKLDSIKAGTAKKLRTTTTTKSTKAGKPTIATIDFDFGDVPPVDKNGFLNPQAFQLMLTQALSNGLKRSDVIEAVKGKLYFGDTPSQASKVLKTYGLTPDEIKKLGVK